MTRWRNTQVMTDNNDTALMYEGLWLHWLIYGKYKKEVHWRTWEVWNNEHTYVEPKSKTRKQDYSLYFHFDADVVHYGFNVVVFVFSAAVESRINWIHWISWAVRMISLCHPPQSARSHLPSNGQSHAAGMSNPVLREPSTLLFQFFCF